MTKLKITRYADPSHSWFKVPRKLIRQYDIETLISSCSYQLGDYVYLEEDCDFAIFMKAVTRASDLTWEMITEVAEIKTSHTNKSSKIRNYPRFIPNFNRPNWVEGQKVRLYDKEYTMMLSGENKVLFDGSMHYSIKPRQLDEMFLVDQNNATC